MTISTAAGRFGSGRAVKRVEDAALLAGKGLFVDNVGVDGQTYIAFQRSPYAHARIVAIDTDAARTMPGVLAVYTGAQLEEAGVKPIAPGPGFKRADGTPHATPARRALAHEFVRFVGEPVIAVVATSREAARGGGVRLAVGALEAGAGRDGLHARRHQLRAGVDREHAGHRARCIGIDRNDPRVRIRRALERDVALAVDGDVVDEQALAGEQRRVLDPLDRAAAAETAGGSIRNRHGIPRRLGKERILAARGDCRRKALQRTGV